jgi:hypothetical protein
MIYFSVIVPVDFFWVSIFWDFWDRIYAAKGMFELESDWIRSYLD